MKSQAVVRVGPFHGRDPSVCPHNVPLDEAEKPLGRGFFVWGPGTTFWWPPVRPIRGHDEHSRRTIGVITKLGSIFYAWPCGDRP